MDFPPEIKYVIGDPEKDNLKDEIVQIKTNEAFRLKQLKVFIQFILYFLCLFIPIILIIIFWNDHRNGKWFQLGLVLFPTISFLYDRNAFVDIFRFTLFKKFRKKTKEKIRDEISENYH